MSHESDGLSRSLAALSSFFVGGATLHETLTEVSSLACQTITPADMVGITMLVEGKPGTAIFTDEAAVEIDAAQYRTGKGPCMDAFASQATIALANAQAYWDAHELSLQLSEAMQSRSTIEQAKGIIMATKPCTPDEAFQVLVRASQRENRKLRDIAEALVANAQLRKKGA